MIKQTVAILALSATPVLADFDFSAGGLSGSVEFDTDTVIINCTNASSAAEFGETDSWQAGYWSKMNFAEGDTVDLNGALTGWVSYYHGKSESQWSGWMAARICFLSQAAENGTLDSVLSDMGASEELIVELAHDAYTTGEEDWDQYLLDSGIDSSAYSSEVALWNAYVAAKIAAENGIDDPLAFPFTVANWESFGTSYSHAEVLGYWNDLTDAEKTSMIAQAATETDFEDWAASVDVFSYS